jgi:hypothetical protein
MVGQPRHVGRAIGVVAHLTADLLLQHGDQPLPAGRAVGLRGLALQHIAEGAGERVVVQRILSTGGGVVVECVEEGVRLPPQASLAPVTQSAKSASRGRSARSTGGWPRPWATAVSRAPRMRGCAASYSPQNRLSVFILSFSMKDSVTINVRLSMSGRVTASKVLVIIIGRRLSKMISPSSVKSLRTTSPPPVLIRQKASYISWLKPVTLSND